MNGGASDAGEEGRCHENRFFRERRRSCRLSPADAGFPNAQWGVSAPHRFRGCMSLNLPAGLQACASTMMLHSTLQQNCVMQSQSARRYRHNKNERFENTTKVNVQHTSFGTAVRSPVEVQEEHTSKNARSKQTRASSYDDDAQRSPAHPMNVRWNRSATLDAVLQEPLFSAEPKEWKLDQWYRQKHPLGLRQGDQSQWT